MNKIYRIVFNAVTGRWVVASELATGRKKQGGGERLVVAVLVTGALGSLMGAAHAGVVVNGDPQEATVGCELITDSGTTTWTASTSAGACLAPSLAGSASGQGNPGANAVFYASNKTNGSEDSLNLGGYLDAWKTATFHGGVAMDGQKITGLANGTAATDAATFGQLTDATRLFRASSAGADPALLTSESIAIGGGSQAGMGGYSQYSANIAVGSNTLAGGGNSIALGTGAKAGSRVPYPNTGDLIAIGTNAQAEYGHSIAIGGNAKVDVASNGTNGYGNAVGIGDSATVTQGGGTALGATASVTTQYGTALGFGAAASGSAGATAVGQNANAFGAASIAIGQRAKNMASANNSLAIGGDSKSGDKSVTIGNGADTSTQSWGVAVGTNAAVTGATGVAVGAGSSVSGTNAVAIGANAVADRANTVSVGKLGGERQVANMAKGTVDTDAVNVSQLKGVTTALGGGAAVNADGTIKAPSYALANANTIGGTSGAATDAGAGFAKVDSALGAVNTAVTQNTANIADNTTSINSLQTTVNNISNGTIGMVQQSAAGANLTVGKDTDGAAVDFADKNGTARKLLKVAAGTVASGSTDAVNGGQLYTTNQNVAQNTADIGTLDGRVTNAEGNITNLQTTVNNISNGTAGLVQQSSAGANLTVGKGTDGAAVDFADKNGVARKLLKVAAGTVASGSTDAVNGGQLYTTNQNVAQNTTDIAGNTTSINTLQTTVNNISNGSIGLVQQSAAGADLTVGAGTDGAAVDFTNTNGVARKLKGVAIGTLSATSTDAVNGAQLNATNQVVADNVANIDALDTRMDTAEGNITTLDNRVTQNTIAIAGNTTSINNLQTTVNNISNGSVGLVQQSAAGADLTVGKGTDGAAVDFTDVGGKTRTLKGVAAGDASSGSTEAVNGSQLYATNKAVAQNATDIDALDTRMGTAEGNITTLDNRVTTNEGDISNIRTDVTKIDGRVTTVEGNINTLNSSVNTLNNNFDTLDGRVTNVEGSVTSITNQLNSGEIGLVQYDDAAGMVTVAKDKAGAALDFRGTAGARRLKGVAAGGEDEDAVNVSQLKKMADAIGGGAKVNADGSITGPTYYVTNADGSKSSVTNMGDALSNIDGRVYNNTTQIQSISTQISSGTIGMVQQAGAGQKLTVGKDTDGSEVDFADKDGNARKLTNVADGKVEAGSKEAVNGGQLHAVSQSVASALGGGSVVNADGTVTAPTYTVTNADGSSSQVNGVEGAIGNIDNRVYQNTTAITNNTTAINNLSTQISNGEVGLVKQDAATRQITVAKDSDGTSVSMDGTAGDRVVTGVAAGKADNDAVNLGQLKSAGIISANGEAKTVVTYDDAGKSSMTMGGEGATTAVTIHNVSDGVADHDAVNVSQLNQRLQQNTTEVLVQANSYTDQKLGDVWTGMDKLANDVAHQDSRISQHGAMSMAESQMASGAAAAAVGNPNGAWSVGLGSEQGHGAISAGYAKPIGAKSQISFGAAFSGDDHSVGMGFAHRL